MQEVAYNIALFSIASIFLTGAIAFAFMTFVAIKKVMRGDYK